jgi:hypothetical protein
MSTSCYFDTMHIVGRKIAIADKNITFPDNQWISSYCSTNICLDSNCYPLVLYWTQLGDITSREGEGEETIKKKVK